MPLIPFKFVPFDVQTGPGGYPVPEESYTRAGLGSLAALARATYYPAEALELAGAEIGRVLRGELAPADQLGVFLQIVEGAKLAAQIFGLPLTTDPSDPLLYPTNFPPAVLLGKAPFAFPVAPQTLAEAGMLALELVSRASYYNPERLEEIGELFGRIYVGSVGTADQQKILDAARAYADRMRTLYKLPLFDVTKPETFAHTSGARTGGCGGGCGTMGARTGARTGGACCDGCASGRGCDGARTGLDQCADQHVIDPEADWPRPGGPTDNPCAFFGCGSGVLAGCHDDRCPVPFSTLFGPAGNADFGRCG